MPSRKNSFIQSRAEIQFYLRIRISRFKTQHTCGQFSKLALQGDQDSRHNALAAVLKFDHLFILSNICNSYLHPVLLYKVR
ncbi:hypothetical protein RND71_012724 [Anisodus tanguticus]|uniref:Uncharacterized protein n=1 Tax=Anisodus tanguticus TaxID=243964 RepID=A0AAE1VH85_9SOLA|nr:hypothetical protein RND71_012724 [Anisodus tanguticus]